MDREQWIERNGGGGTTRRGSKLAGRGGGVYEAESFV